MVSSTELVIVIVRVQPSSVLSVTSLPLIAVIVMSANPWQAEAPEAGHTGGIEAWIAGHRGAVRPRRAALGGGRSDVAAADDDEDRGSGEHQAGATSARCPDEVGPPAERGPFGRIGGIHAVIDVSCVVACGRAGSV